MKKTKICKNCNDQFTPYNSFQKFCSKTGCIQVWVEVEKAKQWLKKKREKKAELMTVQDWIKIAQATFNSYIRERDKDKGCISCGKPLTKKFDAGHFYNANNHHAIRFNPDNVHGQCVECNQWKHGNLIEYRKALIERIGITAFSWLEDYANDTRKFTIDQLKEITEIYKQKIKILKKDR